jgi:hypothetical protein
MDDEMIMNYEWNINGIMDTMGKWSPKISRI